MIEKLVLLLNVPGLGPAALPAVSPVAYQEFETECVNLHARLEANAKIAEVHFVLVGVCQKEAEVAGDGEEEVVVKRRQVRELVDEQLRYLF